MAVNNTDDFPMD